ncbi:MAG: hypothetical protein M3040_10020 [Bacteroidota bacterium]|nr:hypothetical protein [Bacteroidota bacterium]
MNNDNIINIIQLASIIITGSLGIAGTITHTKDEKGNLTRWGIITVVGIMLTNSFSFIESYLKQEKDQTNQIENLKKEQLKAKADEIKFRQTINLLTNNIQKSDSSEARGFF